MKLSRLHRVAVICSDYPRSLAFYTKMLGLRLIAENYRASRKSYKAGIPHEEVRTDEYTGIDGLTARPIMRTDDVRYAD